MIVRRVSLFAAVVIALFVLLIVIQALIIVIPIAIAFVLVGGLIAALREWWHKSRVKKGLKVIDVEPVEKRK